MAVTSRWYAEALLSMAKGALDLDTGGTALKIALFDNTYTPNPDTDLQFALLSGEISGTGYTAGGQAIAGQSVGKVDDASMTAWAAATAYDVGDLVRPAAANGYIYRCIVGGTSGGTEPTFPTVLGKDIADNTATWENLGSSFIKFDFTDPSWTPNTTISAYKAVVYVDAAGPADILVMYIDFGQQEVSTNGDFNIILPGDGAGQLSVS